MVLVAAGTVYSVVNVFAAGLICPKTRYVIAMLFPYVPININGCGMFDSTLVTVPAVALLVKYKLPPTFKLPPTPAPPVTANAPVVALVLVALPVMVVLPMM